MNLALLGFSHAYADTAEGAPITRRTQATALVLQESIVHDADLILEAGRAEGHRDRREAQHFALYDYHSAKLSKALTPILKRADTADVARQAVEHASAASQAGMNPVQRRRAVLSLVSAAILAHVHADDRQTLNGLNADGWAHATASGQAEAEATPAKGGPPDTSLVGGLAITALAALTRAGSPGSEIASTWTDQQLHTIAMGAALAAGDGAAFDQAVRKVTGALVDTGRATKTYAMQLHQTLNATFVQSVNAQNPEAMFDFVNGGADPCDDCIEASMDNPYAPDDLPDCPLHANCYCGIEQAASALVNA